MGEGANECVRGLFIGWVDGVGRWSGLIRCVDEVDF